MSKVFIVQEVLKRDHTTGNMVATMDYRRALPYGELVSCLGGGRVSLTPGPTIDILKEKLRNFSDDDYLIPTGDPSAIGIAFMVASENNRGRVKCLKWDRDSKSYIEVQIDLNYRRNQTSPSGQKESSYEKNL